MADPNELRVQWADLELQWAAATERAEALPAGAVDERVAGEWSFAETLRHLVYASDAWLRLPVLGEPSPFWPAGVPHAELPDGEAAACGIDRGAAPTWAATLEARADRQALVRGYLADVTAADLDRRCAPGAPPPGLGTDSDTLTVAECLATILEEEAGHLSYATRDLRVLEGRHGEAGV